PYTPLFRPRPNTSATPAAPAASATRAAASRGSSCGSAMRRSRAVLPSTRRQSATASARSACTVASSSTSPALAAMAAASACGKWRGATSASRRSPMVFIARAAAPMLPGCWVPTSTTRMRPAAAPAVGAGGLISGSCDMGWMLNCHGQPTRWHVLLSPPIPHARPTRPESFPMLKPAVNVMIKAARAGGNVLVRHMHRLDALNVVEKDRHDYASEVDGLAEAEVIKELRRANP